MQHWIAQRKQYVEQAYKQNKMLARLDEKNIKPTKKEREENLRKKKKKEAEELEQKGRGKTEKTQGFISFWTENQKKNEKT